MASEPRGTNGGPSAISTVFPGLVVVMITKVAADRPHELGRLVANYVGHLPGWHLVQEADHPSPELLSGQGVGLHGAAIGGVGEEQEVREKATRSTRPCSSSRTCCSPTWRLRRPPPADR